MKKFISLISLISILSAGPAAFAFSEIAITAGALTTETDSEEGTDTSSGTGFFAGILGVMEIQDSFYLRSGAVLAQRNFSAGEGDTEVDYELLNLEVPITGMYMFNDMIGAFGGVRVGINTGDSCEHSNSSTDVCEFVDAEFETIFYGAEIGGHFRFTPNFGVEAAYVIGLSDLATTDPTTGDDDTLGWDGGLVINGFFIF